MPINATNAQTHRHSRVPGSVDPKVLIPSSLLTDLVEYWRLEEASGTRYGSKGVYDLTDNGSVTNAAGILGNATSHAVGSQQYLSLAGTVIPAGNSRTISMWVYPTDVSAQRPFASGGATFQSGTPLFLMVLRQGGGSGPFAVFHGNAYRSGTTVAALNTWYHVVYTFNSSSSAVELWINGTREVNLTVGDANSAAILYLGAGFNANFGGRIDEVGLWKRALSSAEVATLYKAGAGVTYPYFD